MAPLWTIYCHTHSETGRHYVGLTKKTMESRWRAHVQNSRRDDGRWHFPNAVRVYGEDAFEHHVLETCSTLEEANASERRWVALMGARNPALGFNLKDGGLHVPHESRNPWDRPGYRERRPKSVRPEVKAAIAESLRRHYSERENREGLAKRSREVHSRPEVREKLVRSSSGRTFGPEARANNSRAQTGKKGQVFSEQSLASISSSLRGNKNSLGRKHDPDLRRKIGEGVRKASALRRLS
jgi:hypothetical protein